MLVHRFWSNQSYLMRGTGGQQDLGEGEAFELGFAGFEEFPYSEVFVQEIDARTQIARIRLRYRPALRNRGVEFADELLGGVTVDGGGWLVVGGKIVPVPPWDPLLPILEQLALYRALDDAREPSSRDQLRREVLTDIAQLASGMADELTTFKSPPPVADIDGGSVPGQG